MLPIQLWFFAQHFDMPEHWNQSFLIKVPPLDVEQIITMIAQLAEQHDVLRLTFQTQRRALPANVSSEHELPEFKVADRSPSVMKNYKRSLRMAESF